MPKKNIKLSDDIIKRVIEQKKLSMRKAREKIKQDPVKYAEEKEKEKKRYHQRKKDKKIRTIDQFTSREQRNLRKARKIQMRTYTANQKKKVEAENFLESNTPPESPSSASQNPNEAGPSGLSRKASGQKRARKNRDEMKKKVDSLENQLKSLKIKIASMNKQSLRMKHKEKKIQGRDCKNPSKFSP